MDIILKVDTLRMIQASLVEIGLVVSEEKNFEMIYDRQDANSTNDPLGQVS